MSRCFQFCVHSSTKILYEMTGDKNEVPKQLRVTLDKYNIMGWFSGQDRVCDNGEVLDPNTLLLVGSFRTIDPHY